jgi:hypothetical protein
MVNVQWIVRVWFLALLSFMLLDGRPLPKNAWAWFALFNQPLYVPDIRKKRLK